MISSGNFGRTSRSTIQSMVLTSRVHCMMRIRRRGTSIVSAQFLTRLRTRLAFASREWTRRTCTLGCGSHCFHGTRRTWISTVLTTCITERQSHGMQCHQNMAVGWNVWLPVGSILCRTDSTSSAVWMFEILDWITYLVSSYYSIWCETNPTIQNFWILI